MAIRVYIACSLDGFIAGPDNDLSWLPGPDDVPPAPGEGLSYEAFMADVGAMLMGRTTYDVVRGFGGEWPYDKPIVVATRRVLTDAPAGVQAGNGGIDALLDQAVALADGRDVYVDGGSLVRQALDAGRVDELVITTVPTVLGAGASLFGGLAQRHAFERVRVTPFGPQMVQWTLRPQRA